MLSIIEGRVLGCLVEKEHTVPDQYPLTMNALLSACNQSTSREPVMRLGEHEVMSALTSMKTEGFVRLVHPSHGRSATRYRHVVYEHLDVDDGAAVLLAVMLLRGPQTLSELRTRTERQHGFESLDEIEVSLQDLAGRGFVRLLDRQPGQKEARWQQLVADEAAPVSYTAQPTPAPAAWSAAPQPAPGRSGVAESDDDRCVAPGIVRPVASPPPPAPGLADKVAELEARVAKLEAALADLL